MLMEIPLRVVNYLSTLELNIKSRVHIKQLYIKINSIIIANNGILLLKLMF